MQKNPAEHERREFGNVSFYENGITPYHRSADKAEYLFNLNEAITPEDQ